jgi:hypothetical protein
MLNIISSKLISYVFIQPYVDWFKWEDAKHPLSNAPEPKSRFIPSKWEAKKASHFIFY